MENVSVGNPSVGTGNCGYVKPSRQYKGLVVDDEEVICEMLQDMVSGVGTVYFLDKLNVRVIHTINGSNA